VGEGGDPWIKADAVLPALLESAAEIVIVADADVWCDGLPAAVEAIEDGAPWAVPHATVHRLDEEGSRRYMAGESFEGLPLDRRPYRGVMGGGYVVAPRETLLEVPLDPRFVGWGQEDLSWALALTTLAGGRWRGRAPLVHLWHPPQQRLSMKIGSKAGRALWKRYQAAANDPAAMRDLIGEIDHERFNLHRQAVHDSPPLRVGGDR
jgi:hypothetical protein